MYMWPFQDYSPNPATLAATQILTSVNSQLFLRRHSEPTQDPLQVEGSNTLAVLRHPISAAPAIPSATRVTPRAIPWPSKAQPIITTEATVPNYQTRHHIET
jgi:hypothetical protein